MIGAALTVVVVAATLLCCGNAANRNDRVICPRGECVVYGDSRSDPEFRDDVHDYFNETYKFLAGRVSAKSGDALYSKFVQRASYSAASFVYDMCGEHKIFYEGVNLSPSHGVKCTDWIDTDVMGYKRPFYRNIYELGYSHKCLKSETLPVFSHSHAMTPVEIPGCEGNNRPSGLRWYRSTDVLEYNTEMFSTISGLNIDAVYLIPLCYWRYDSAAVLQTTGQQSTLENIIRVEADSDRELYFFNNTEIYGRMDEALGRTTILECKMFQVSNTATLTYRYGGGVGFLSPVNAIVFTEPFPPEQYRAPVQVVESKWSWKRISNAVANREACREAGPDKCVFFDVPEYLGQRDSEHGCEFIRELFSEIPYTPNGEFCDGQAWTEGCPSTCSNTSHCKTIIGDLAPPTTSSPIIDVGGLSQDELTKLIASIVNATMIVAGAAGGGASGDGMGGGSNNNINVNETLELSIMDNTLTYAYHLSSIIAIPFAIIAAISFGLASALSVYDHFNRRRKFKLNDDEEDEEYSPVPQAARDYPSIKNRGARDYVPTQPDAQGQGNLSKNLQAFLRPGGMGLN